MGLIRVNHQQDAPQPWADKPALDLAERVTLHGDILRHPIFTALLRARPLNGRGKNQYYCPRGDIQIRRVDGPWPVRWLEDVDLVGEIHNLGFDCDPRFPRGPDAFDVFRRRLQRALASLGIE